MMTTMISAALTSGSDTASEITDAHFQTVLVGKYAFQDDNIDRLTQGSDMDGAMDQLDISSVRFPGGTEAWDGSFDFRDPDHVAQLHEVIDYCATQNVGLQFTVNVREFLTAGTFQSGGEGTRTFSMSAEDEAALRAFLQDDLLQYAADRGVVVENIKLGNEPLAGSDMDGDNDAGDPNPADDDLRIGLDEYGNAASELAIIVGETIEAFETSAGNTAYTTTSNYTSPDVVLELPNWSGGVDQLLSEFNPDAAQYITAMDAHAAHWTLEASYDELLGTGAVDGWRDDAPVSEHMASVIDYMNQEWASMTGDQDASLTYLNEAWAVDETGVQGLGQALLTFHSMSLAGLDSATVWTALSYGGGGYQTTSALYVETRDRIQPVGVLYEQMATHLKGMKAVSLDTGLTGAEEAALPQLTRVFYDEAGRAVIYIANRLNADTSVDVNLQNLLQSLDGFENGIADIEAVVIGAVNNNTSAYGRGDIEIFGDDVLGTDIVVDGINLAAYEVLQISVTANGEFGTDGNDVIDTSTNADTDDWIIGYDGNDTIYTGGGADRIDAGAGDDIIDGGAGADVISAGDGDDTVTGGYGPDQVDLGAGNDIFIDDSQPDVWGADTVEGGDGNDTIHGGGGDDTFYGGNGEDTIFGGDDNDYIDGDADDDILRGEAGDDYILGGLGDDFIEGGSGNDLLYGGAGNDIIYVYTENGRSYSTDDKAYGEEGNDTIYGSNGRQSLYGGAGDDYLNGGDDSTTSDRDYLYGGDGNDTLVSGQTRTPTSDTQGNGDYLYGEAGDDTLVGGKAKDFLFGGSGNDIIHGGAGDDVIYVHTDGSSAFSDGDEAYGDAGNDRIYGSNGGQWLEGGAGNDYLNGGNDSITSDRDYLYGGDGDDKLVSGQTRAVKSSTQSNGDQLYGEAGDDTLVGGKADDLLSGGSGNDMFIFSDNFGRDRITDFDATNSNEVIDLSGVSAIANYADLISGNYLSQSGSDVLITVDADNVIILENVLLSDLDATDFIL